MYNQEIILGVDIWSQLFNFIKQLALCYDKHKADKTLTCGMHYRCSNDFKIDVILNYSLCWDN